jgi:glutamate-1-semialdehyde 2,1-aminomutase
LGLLLLALLASIAARKIATIILTFRASALAPTLSRRLSEWVKSLDYSEREAWAADGASERWIQRRKDAIDRLAGFFQTQCSKSIAWGNDIRGSFSDLRFTDANRVPFPFMRICVRNSVCARW